MKKSLFLPAVCVALAALIAGCAGRNEELDKEAITDLVAADTVWFDAGTPEDSTREQPTMLMATADSIFWWRGSQTPDAPDIFVDPVGDSGYVEWNRHSTGNVNIFAFLPDTGWVHWDKPLGETSEIRGIFRRTGAAADSNRGWVLEKISCAVGKSDNGTITIDSIHIVSSENDIWLKSPFVDHFYDVADLVTFNSLEEVTMTIYTTSDKETVAYLHAIVGLWPVRDTFANMGDGVHEGTWNAQLIPAARFVIFDVMANSTLWDDDGTYDYTGVLFPYRTAWPQ